MPPQATKDWLSLLDKNARERDIYVDTDIDGRIFHFHLGKNPGIIGKVRYSEAKSRNYENEQGQKHIWHRYNREKELIKQGSEREVTALLKSLVVDTNSVLNTEAEFSTTAAFGSVQID